MGLEYLKKKRLHNWSGKPVPMLCHSHSKGDLPCVCMELLMYQFWSVAPFYIAACHWKVCLHQHDSHTLDNSTEVTLQSFLLQAGQSQVSQPFLRKEDAPGPSSSLWLSAGLSPVVLWLSWTREPRTRQKSHVSGSLENTAFVLLKLLLPLQWLGHGLR